MCVGLFCWEHFCSGWPAFHFLPRRGALLREHSALLSVGRVCMLVARGFTSRRHVTGCQSAPCCLEKNPIFAVLFRNEICQCIEPEYHPAHIAWRQCAGSPNCSVPSAKKKTICVWLFHSRGLVIWGANPSSPTHSNTATIAISCPLLFPLVCLQIYFVGPFRCKPYFGRALSKKRLISCPF